MNRRRPESAICFVVDAMLGRLARWLRILGYDTIYCRDVEDERLVEMAIEKGAILLTRDTRIRERKRLPELSFVTSDKLVDQLRELIDRHGLVVDEGKLLSRCVVCNARLRAAGMEAVAGRVPEFVLHTCPFFRQCPSCERVYWGGSHPSRIRAVLDEVTHREGRHCE